MLPMPQKIIDVTPPAAIVDNAAFTTTEIDTLGYDYCVILAHIGATDIAMTVCKVQESDTSGSGFADITGLDTDGDTNWSGSTAVLPSATDDNTVVTFCIDLRGRKRYLDLSATAGDGTTGTYLSAMALLYRGDVGPASATDMGDVNEVMVV